MPVPTQRLGSASPRPCAADVQRPSPASIHDHSQGNYQHHLRRARARRRARWHERRLAARWRAARGCASAAGVPHRGVQPDRRPDQGPRHRWVRPASDGRAGRSVDRAEGGGRRRVGPGGQCARARHLQRVAVGAVRLPRRPCEARPSGGRAAVACAVGVLRRLRCRPQLLRAECERRRSAGRPLLARRRGRVRLGGDGRAVGDARRRGARRADAARVARLDGVRAT